MQKKHYLSSHTSDSPNETVWRSSSGASAACGSAVIRGLYECPMQAKAK